MSQCSRRWWIAWVLVGACATGGGGGGDDDMGTPDASMSLGPDAAITLGPDAAVATPDAAPACLACSLVPQSGCGGADACDLDDTNFAMGCTSCRPVTAQGTATSTCAAVTECAAGWVCLGSASGSSCLKYCKGDGDCSSLGAGAICAIGLVAGMTPIPGATVCSHACQPHLAGAGCPSGWGCHLYQEAMGAMRLFVSCAPPGGGGHLASCTSNSSCQAGFSCYTDGTSNFCLKNCNATTGAGCTGAGVPPTCNSFSPPAVVGGVEYGYCF